MRYIPHTKTDIVTMLNAMGLDRLAELFCDIPADLQVKADISSIGKPLAEWELSNVINGLASNNTSCSELICFRGCGAYDHWVPAAVSAIVSRAEYLTAYTPYQAEVSQGFLQAIYEYQTMICRLMKMDISNASMYDGATALAEAALMACRCTGRSKVIIDRRVNPIYIDVVKTYASFAGYEITVCDVYSHPVSKEDAAMVVQVPDFIGEVKSPSLVFNNAKGQGALSIAVVDPVTLGIIAPPGEYGADIAVGDGQSIGSYMGYGGPTLGLMAVSEKLLRRMPGRLVGRTKDKKGRQGFVLTLQTREQHIRRQHATSNICSNESLNALAAVVYLSLAGAEGLKRLGLRLLAGGQYFIKAVCQTDTKIKRSNNYPFFREVALLSEIPPHTIEAELLPKGILSGMPVTDNLRKYWDPGDGVSIWCITEKRSQAEIDQLSQELVRLGR